MSKNVGDLGKFIVAKGFKKLPKVQKIAKSGDTDSDEQSQCSISSNGKIIFLAFLEVTK